MLDHLCWGVSCDDFPIAPPRLVADLRRAIPEDGILCLDNGLYKVCPENCGRFCRSHFLYLSQDNDPHKVWLANFGRFCRAHGLHLKSDNGLYKVCPANLADFAGRMTCV